MRDLNLKIPDIKAVRSITMFLGKLGLDTCRRHIPPPPHPWQNSPVHKPWMFGLGLAEAKAYVEAKYNYMIVSNSPHKQFADMNDIHITKRVRQTMNMLNKLGLKTPDANQQPCRAFVARMRARR